MTVRYFEWGVAKGGTTPSGASIPAEAGYGPPETFEGTLPAGNTTITFTRATKNVHIINNHDNLTLEYSLDGGVDWFNLGPYGHVTEPIAITSLLLRGAGCTYEITAALSS